jgi:Xaa-Pro aminopeptidase
MYYLSGIDQEKSILVLFPNAPLPQYREALFILESNEQIAIWEGHKYTKEEAQAASGIENIFYIEDFDAALEKIMLLAEKVYLNLNENDRAVNDVPYKDIRFAKDLKERFPLHDYGRANPILAKLRTIKSELEIETIQSACNITEKAFRRVLGFIKPNVYEYEIEAEIIHEFITNRSNGHAYEPIIASGANACCLHYGENNDICKDGEMILMDFGADYANYASDLTRTIPVNGIFSERQKEVYNANLKVMKEASSMLRPGITLDDFNKEVGKVMESALIDIKLLDATDVKNQNPHSPLYRKYFMHGTSHFMGLDVHDIGNRYEPIKEGMVFTCEPGIYIREEGLGIRLENDLFIGANENTDLMANIPIEIEEIESLMNK